MEREMERVPSVAKSEVPAQKQSTITRQLQPLRSLTLKPLGLTVKPPGLIVKPIGLIV